MPMKKPSNWIVVSGISRMRVITDHWFGSTPEGPPAPTAEVYETLLPTTGRSRPVIGSTIDVRGSGCSVIGFQTGSDGANVPARSCSTLIACMPPWLWPTIIGRTPSCS